VRIERTESPRRLWGLFPRAGGRLDVTLTLPSPEALFAAPAAGPLSEHYAAYGDQPALDAIVAEMEARKIPSAVHATIELPAATIDPSLEQRLRDAVGRYCRVKLARIDVELRKTRRLGVRSLVLGFVVVFVLNAISQKLDSSRNEFVQALSQGLSIVSWVTLWFPVNLLLYDRWYYRRDQRLYQTLLELEISVKPSR